MRVITVCPVPLIHNQDDSACLYCPAPPLPRSHLGWPGRVGSELTLSLGPPGGRIGHQTRAWSAVAPGRGTQAHATAGKLWKREEEVEGPPGRWRQMVGENQACNSHPHSTLRLHLPPNMLAGGWGRGWCWAQTCPHVPRQPTPPAISSISFPVCFPSVALPNPALQWPLAQRRDLIRRHSEGAWMLLCPPGGSTQSLVKVWQKPGWGSEKHSEVWWAQHPGGAGPPARPRLLHLSVRGRTTAPEDTASWPSGKQGLCTCGAAKDHNGETLLGPPVPLNTGPQTF